MSDEVKVLELLLKTKADLKDAVALQQSLERSKTRAQLLGKEFTETDAQLKRVGQAIDGYKARNKDAGDEVEKLELHHHALHKIMHMIGSETAPELGEALTGSLYGEIGLAIAAGAAFEFFAKKIELAHEKAVALSSLRWEASAASANEFLSAIDSIGESLEKASKLQDPIKSQFDEELAVLNQQLESHQKILDAMEQEELTAAGADEAQKAQIKARYDLLKKTTADAGEQQKLQAKQDELDARKEAQPGLDSTAKYYAGVVASLGTGKEFTAAQSALKLTPAEQKKIDEAHHLIEKTGGREATEAAAQKAHEDYLAGAHAAGVAGGVVGPENNYYANALQLTEPYDKNRAIVDEQNRRIEEAKRKEADATEKATANQNAITEGTKGLSQDRKVYFEKTAGEDVSKAIGISRRAAAGGQVSKEEEQFVAMMGGQIAGQAVNVKQAETMFNIASKNQQLIDNFMTRLMNALMKMPDYTHFNAVLEKLEKKMSEFESRLKNQLNP